MRGGKVYLPELDNYTKGGLYALAEKHPKKGRFPIKIGRTIDFKKRLNSYHLCFNSGFHLLAILPLKPQILDEHRLVITSALENACSLALSARSIKPRVYKNRVSRGSEWYNADLYRIRDVFSELHVTFELQGFQFTSPPVFDFNNEFINVFNEEGTKLITNYIARDAGAMKIKLTKTVVKKRMKKLNLLGYRKKGSGRRRTQ